MSALSRCMAEVEALGQFHRQHGDELIEIGKQARGRNLAGEDRDSVYRWYARETVAVYAGAGREAPGWTAPLLVETQAAAE